MINIKTPKQIEKMRKGGEILRLILVALKTEINPGMAKLDLEKKARELLQQYKVKPTFLGYRGYPAVSCISLNSEIVHGIPDKTVIREGDSVSVDLGIRYAGLCLDAAFTTVAGKISQKQQKLLKVTQDALRSAIENTKAGIHLGDVQEKIQKTIEKGGFTVVKDLAGHGIGLKPQEEPFILNFGKAGTGPVLQEGMTLAFEPMVTTGKGEIVLLADGWTITSSDKAVNAHFEDTVVVGKEKAESLTGQYKN